MQKTIIRSHIAIYTHTSESVMDLYDSSIDNPEAKTSPQFRLYNKLVSCYFCVSGPKHDLKLLAKQREIPPPASHFFSFF